eukprot:499357_1
MIVCVSAYQFKYRIDIKKLDYDTTIQTCVKKYHQHAALQAKKQLAAQQQEAKNENEDTTQENDMLGSVEEERNDKVTESNFVALRMHQATKINQNDKYGWIVA